MTTNAFPGDVTTRTGNALAAALKAISEDYNANWRYLPTDEQHAVEAAINALDDVLSNFQADMARIEDERPDDSASWQPLHPARSW